MAALEKRVEMIEGQLEHATRVLEQVVTNQAELDKVMTTLADAYIRTQEQYARTQEQFRETAEFMRETDRRFRETTGFMSETDRRLRETDALLQETIRENRASKQEADARGRDLDLRIQQLVSGIGEFIRQSSKPN